MKIKKPRVKLILKPRGLGFSNCKTFFDYQNDPNYCQDMETGEFINIKTGEGVRFGIGIKK